MTTYVADAETNPSVPATDQGPEPPVQAAPRRRFAPRRGQLWAAGAIVVGYLLLVLFGVTQSSLAYSFMLQDPAHPTGTTIGEPRGIRSDEFGVDTPLLLGLSAAGSDSVDAPLSAPDDLISAVPTHGGLFASLVDFDASAMRLGTVLPVASLFAARWWLPWLLLLLALPPWLRRVGATTPMSWFATALVAAAPAAAWWSDFPIRILGFAVAGSYLGMTAATAFGRRRWMSGAAQAALAGLLLSRLATWYIPWSITLAAPVLVATVCWLVVDRDRRRGGLLAIGVAGAVSVVLVAGLYLTNWASLTASMDTVYPGQRRSSAGANPLALLFGAPGQAYYQSGHDLTSSNVSEMSSAFTICAVWAAMLFLTAPQVVSAVRSRTGHGAASDRFAWLRTDAESWVVRVLAVSTALELLWCTVDLGGLGAHVPVLNRVPSSRAAETVGFIAVLLVSLMLSRRGPATSRRVPLLAAVACAVVTAYGVSDLHTFSPTMGARVVVASAVAVFVVVYTVSSRPDRWRWVAVAAVLAGACVVVVNPVQVGVGDLRDSASAQTMLKAGAAARAEHSYWATDGADTDILLIATGVPSVSGIQDAGPDRAAWERLDPHGRMEAAWNRGGASVEITWLPAGSPEITNGAPDQISLAVDPCDLVRRGFRVGHIMSQTPLANSCLRPAGQLAWAGTTRYLYTTGA